MIRWPLVIFAMLVFALGMGVLVYSADVDKDFAMACHARGGLTFSYRGARLCVKRDVVIEI